MNAVDVAIVVVLVAGALNGFRRGFIIETASILGAVIAVTVAKHEYVPVRRVLSQAAPHSSWLTAISYLIVFLLVWAIIIAVARVARRVARLLLLGWADRLGGLVVGLLESALLLELLLYLGRHVPDRSLHHAIAHSHLTPLFQDVVPLISKAFPRF